MAGEGTADRVLSVSELVARLRAALWRDPGDVRVAGEIAGLHVSRAGHVYFELVDAEARLRCVLFQSDASRMPFALRDGMEVRVAGRPDVYAARGALQLTLRAVEPAGEGALRIAFEQMRERLAREGLFDPARRRPLPLLPRRIGLVTSLAGAAFHDFLRGVHRRGVGVEICVCDARVQGEDAWRDVVRALHLLDADPSVDVIVLARGGGSLEDLWTFNREEVVRAISELETPLVSAIGHETDVVLTDLVADVRAATPTAAAGCVLPEGVRLRANVDALARRLARAEHVRLDGLRRRLEAVRAGLVHPAQRIARARERMLALGARLGAAAARGLERRSARLGGLGGRLDALSPLSVLGRGYSLTRRARDGAILRSSEGVAAGESIDVRLARGSLLATVERAAEA